MVTRSGRSGASPADGDEQFLPIGATIRHTIAADPERIFDAWLEQKSIRSWIVGARPDDAVVSVENYPSEGGSFTFVVRRQGRDLTVRGTYLELARPSRLSFTWGLAPDPDESVVTINILSSITGGCDVRLTQRMPAHWAQYADGAAVCWTRILRALDVAIS